MPKIWRDIDELIKHQPGAFDKRYGLLLALCASAGSNPNRAEDAAEWLIEVANRLTERIYNI